MTGDDIFTVTVNKEPHIAKAQITAELLQNQSDSEMLHAVV